MVLLVFIQRGPQALPCEPLFIFLDDSNPTTTESINLSTVHITIISSVGAVLCVLIISVLIAYMRRRSLSQQAAQQR